MQRSTYDILAKLLDGAVVVSASGQILYKNESFFRIFDLPAARTRKVKSILDILTFENMEISMADIFQSGVIPSHYVETNFSTKFGKTGVIQIGFQSLEAGINRKERHFILFFRDVSLESRLQTKYRIELAEKDKRIHEISLLRDVAILLVGLTDENSIISRTMEKWMTVGICSAALFLKSEPDGETRRLFFIDRKDSSNGSFMDIPSSPEIESLLEENREVSQNPKIHQRVCNVFKKWYDLRNYNHTTVIPVMGKDSKGLLILFRETANDNLASIEDVTLLKSVMAQMAVALEGAQYFESSIVDTMTRLHNKGYFENRFSNELTRSRRMSKEMTLLICDIDNFKKINDTYGHAVGDIVLKNVAQNIKNSCRGSDLPFRYGGEEFCVILPETNEPGATVFAERLRKIIEESLIQVKNAEIKVTISLGMAIFPAHGSTEKEIFANADKALYESKSNGRNRWTIYGGFSPTFEKQRK